MHFDNIETIGVHDLIPGCDKVVYELFFRIVLCIDFHERPKLGVGAKNKVDAGAGPVGVGVDGRAQRLVLDPFGDPLVGRGGPVLGEVDPLQPLLDGSSTSSADVRPAPGTTRAIPSWPGVRRRAAGAPADRCGSVVEFSPTVASDAPTTDRTLL